ncbi:uncharacterized protein [Phaseolus vulgaris]|uniref:uncharacterized protein n=1 Tax=Phaseolus vulgaris TaxID=3885 RepID=UPI0035CC0DDB
MHGVAIRKVPLTTSGVIDMVHFSAPDTRLVRWCSRAYCVLACSLGRGLSRAAGYYTEITLKLPLTQMATRVALDAVIKDETMKKPRSEWSESDRKKAQFDSVAKNIITSALTMDEFFKISQCYSAKEMWVVLEVTHEGADYVKRSKKHSLIQEYELFIMQLEETITDVQKRFTHIVNHLTRLGKEFDKEELNIKKNHDLSKLSTAALFGNLMEHELELKRLKEQETVEKKTEGLALKASAQNDINEKVEDAEHDEIIRHIEMDCPNNQSKDKPASKKVERSKGRRVYISWEENEDKPASKKVERSKGRRAYISWEENEVSSTSNSSTSSSSTESEETNLCFMMKDEESISDSVSDFSMESDNYDQLLVAFKETHDEANRLAVICSKLQKVNNVLAPKVKSLEEELHKAKIDLVSLELTCLHASIKSCENCKKLEKQVEYLLKTLSNFTKGRNNLDSLLGSQNVVFNKNGIGYNSGKVNNVKKLSSFFVPAKTSFSSFNNGKKAYFVSCFYCMKFGHTSRTCIARKYLV